MFYPSNHHNHLKHSWYSDIISNENSSRENFKGEITFVVKECTYSYFTVMLYFLWVYDIFIDCNVFKLYLLLMNSMPTISYSLIKNESPI
jgi:hypothetical protein